MKRCEIATVDGQLVRVQIDGDLTEEDWAALAEVVRAARAKLAAMPPGPLTVACPTCGVEPGHFCRKQNDRVTSVHQPRWDAIA